MCSSGVCPTGSTEEYQMNTCNQSGTAAEYLPSQCYQSLSQLGTCGVLVPDGPSCGVLPLTLECIFSGEPVILCSLSESSCKAHHSMQARHSNKQYPQQLHTSMSVQHFQRPLSWCHVRSQIVVAPTTARVCLLWVDIAVTALPYSLHKP